MHKNDQTWLRKTVFSNKFLLVPLTIQNLDAGHVSQKMCENMGGNLLYCKLSNAR